MKCEPILALFVITLSAAQSPAAIIRVPQDQATIQAGIDAAAEGDTVELADGVYEWEGNRDLDFGGKDLVVRSASGNAESCVIDAHGSQYDFHRAFDFHSGESPDSRLENLGITGGYWESDYYDGGGGIHCDDHSSPTIVGCYFYGNYGGGLYMRNGSNMAVRDTRFVGNSDRSGGGLSCLSSTLRLYDCEFLNNTAEHSGGALRGQGGNIYLYDCRLIGNVAASGAAIDMIYGEYINLQRCLLEYNVAVSSYWSCIVNFHGMVTGELEDCTVVNNTTGPHGYGIVTSKMSHGILRGCTFYGNTIPSGTLIVFGELDGLVQNTVIASNPAGEALLIGSVVELSCTNIWGNPDGDWTGGIAEYLGVEGNICLDPQFCDPAMGDFQLQASSPCAPYSPPNESCDLIGAWPVGCSTATEATTWSRVKTLF